MENLKKVINLKDFNLKVNPNDDFFEFVNGGWIKNNPVPHDQARWGTFSIMREINNDRLKKIFGELSRKILVVGSDSQKLRDYYFSGINTKKRDEEGLKEIEPLICQIDDIKDHKSFFETVGKFHVMGVGSLWGPNVEQDDKKSSEYIFRLYQGGKGLPDRDYYLKKDKQSQKIRKEYIKYITSIFNLAGFESKEANNFSKIVMKIETELAQVSMTKVDSRNTVLVYNKFTFQDLVKKYPKIYWDEYFKNIGITKPKQLIVSQPKFFTGLNEMLSKMSLGDWRIYLKYKVLSNLGSYTTSAFVRTRFDFYGRVLSGLKKQKPVWKTVISEVDEALGEALGKEYVKRYFSPSAKKHIVSMTNNIKAALKDRILMLDWMHKETKKKALHKLDKFVIKIGYPDKWMDYKKLKIGRDSYLKNHIEAHCFEFHRMMKKLTTMKVNRKEWLMTPQTVNAYCHFNLNEITFPAGILASPFFHDKAPDVMNYGGIGTVIGHEITHGFDDQGCLFDAEGNLKNWWTKKDKESFDKKTKIIEKQFDNFEPIKGHKVNGKLTLGENIADLGGLIIAYNGYLKSLKNKDELKKKINGFTNTELFFVSYAITERGNQTEQYMKQLLQTDPHSPSKWRVLGPLAHIDEFYSAFGCKVGDKMFLSEDKRARIW